MASPPRIGLFLLSVLARALPRPVSYLIGETLGGLSFLLCPERRGNLLANLAVALGRPERSAPRRVGLAAAINFARSVVDTLLAPHMDTGYLEGHVSITDRAGLGALAGSGRGIILVTAHVGSWELGGFALASMGYRITTVAGVQFSRGLSEGIKAMKAGYGIAVTSPAGTLRIFRALRRGEVVALHIDGDQFLGGIDTEFFGRPAVMPRGPAALALRTGAALVPAFAVRRSRSTIEIVVEKEIPAAGADEAGLTRKVVAAAEDVIRRHPGQWCMFRPIWERARCA